MHYMCTFQTYYKTIQKWLCHDCLCTIYHNFTELFYSIHAISQDIQDFLRIFRIFSGFLRSSNIKRSLMIKKLNNPPSWYLLKTNDQETHHCGDLSMRLEVLNDLTLVGRLYSREQPGLPDCVTLLTRGQVIKLTPRKRQT